MTSPLYSDKIRVRRTLRGEGSLWATYYAPISTSFGAVAKQHMRYLPRMGCNIHYVVLEHLIKQAAIPTALRDKQDHWALLHPVFSAFEKTRESFENVRLGHTRLGGFDVADSDRLSEYAVDIANRLDLLMVPTHHSKEIYQRSGVKTRVEAVPHGINETLYSEPKGYLPAIPRDGIKILFFVWHSELRKGADVVRSAIDKILEEYNNVYLIIKTTTQLLRHPRTIRIKHWLAEPDLIRLYDSCDILLSPSRGGGFELNVLEGMARGIVPIVSDWGAIQEYAGAHSLTIRNTGKKVQPLPKNTIHCGYGADPDPEHCYELIKYAIENLVDLKAKAEEAAPKIREEYSWKKTAQAIVKCLNA